MATQTLSIDPFTGVNLTLPATVTISQGDTQEVTATGDQDIIDLLKTTVLSDVWQIALTKNVWKHYDLSIAITIPNLDQLKLNGNGSITVSDFTDQGDLTINMSGSGSIQMHGFDGGSSISVSQSGSGDFTANADISVTSLDISRSGSGSYNAFPISGANCTINSSSNSNAELTATETLDVKITGSGDVSYKGNPTITSNIKGSGKLIDAN